MNMKNRLAVILLGVFATAPFHASGEEGWHWELRTGVAVPTGNLGNAELDTGFGLEGTVAYGFSPNLSGYFGWDYHNFGVDRRLAGTDVDVDETGYVFGAQWQDKLGYGSLDYRVRAGITINHIELENSAGSIVADSGHGPGFELGAALLVPLGAQWTLTPGLRFRMLSRDIPLNGRDVSVDLRYFTVGVGISRPF